MYTHDEREVADILAGIYSLPPEEIEISDISVMKKGMTNRSYIYRYKDSRYILRIPGEGTEKLIDREQEYNSYRAIERINICDNPVYINPHTGYKITQYIENARTCSPYDSGDIKMCMGVLRRLHNMKISVPHTFDIFGNIEFYEKLWGDNKSIYPDYGSMKDNVYRLKMFIEANADEYVFTHIDAVPDNFLIYTGEDGNEHIQLTDWEYAGMQDPYVDIAMFCLYSDYDKEQIDNIIDIYFEGRCSDNIRARIYCYISAGGLLWSDWCEYKRHCGVEFGEYARQQYRYAKEYYRYAESLIKTLKD